MKKTRLLQCLFLLLAFAFTACPTTNPKKDPKKAAHTKQPPAQESSEMDFQAFIGRLRKAVKAHDVNTVASMMTPDFAYVLGTNPAEDRQGAGVFQYWDENGLWVELDGILSERFVSYNGYMVAPPQFADPASEYSGYRAGIRRENGSWKFVYFVNEPGGGPAPTAPAQ